MQQVSCPHTRFTGRLWRLHRSGFIPQFLFIISTDSYKVPVGMGRTISNSYLGTFFDRFRLFTEVLLNNYISDKIRSLIDQRLLKQHSRKACMKGCLILVLLVAISHSLRVLPHMHFKQIQPGHFSRAVSHNVQGDHAEHLILIKSPNSENHYYFAKTDSLHGQTKEQAQSSSEDSLEIPSVSVQYNGSVKKSTGLVSLTGIIVFSEDAIQAFGVSQCTCGASNEGFFDMECNQNTDCSESIQSFDDWTSGSNDFSEDSLPNFIT